MIESLVWLVIWFSAAGAVAALFVAALDEICRYGSRSKTAKIFAWRDRTGRTVFPRLIK